MHRRSSLLQHCPLKSHELFTLSDRIHYTLVIRSTEATPNGSLPHETGMVRLQKKGEFYNKPF